MKAKMKSGKIIKGRLAETFVNRSLAVEVIDDVKENIQKEAIKPKLTAKQVAGIIDKIESQEELKAFESDERQIVKAAFNKKLKEFE